MRKTKVDYDIIKKEYVTTKFSYRELGRRFGINYSTLAQKAKREHWEDERLAYQQAVQRRSYERVADEFAAEEAEIKKESVLVARLTLRKYAELLSSGRVTPQAKDAAQMIQVLAQLMGEPEGGNDDRRIDAIPVNRPDADALRRIVEAARGHVRSAELVEGAVVISAPGTRPN